MTAPGEPARVRLVRHGQVAPEYHGRFYGALDVPLSDEGRRSSLEAAARLALDPPDVVLSSPLQRAALLAGALAQATGAPLVLVPEFHELDRGSWTGRDRDEIEAEHPGAIAGYVADPEHGNGAGGERESELVARVWGALDPLLERHAGRDLVLVAHAHVLRVILRRLLGWSPSESMHHFAPLLGVVEARLAPGGLGELVSAPEALGYDRILRP